MSDESMSRTRKTTEVIGAFFADPQLELLRFSLAISGLAIMTVWALASFVLR